MIRLWPATLRGRLILTLLTGLILAQALVATILLRDRAEALSEARGVGAVQRIAGVIQVLDRMDTEARHDMVKVFGGEQVEVQLSTSPFSVAPEHSYREQNLARALRRQIEHDHEISVNLSRPSGRSLPEAYHERGGLRHQAARGGVKIAATTRLSDGNWIRVSYQLGDERTGWPRRLLLTLIILAGVVISLVLVGVRWLTRPLDLLVAAADDLGQDIHRPPLSISGPAEVQRAATAFNAMQARLQAYLHERERTVAAISHDLRTPLTRLRLRAELISDDELRSKMDRDLEEMEQLTVAALDYLRRAGSEEPLETVDLSALLYSLQSDYEEAGHKVGIHGDSRVSLTGRPLALKRLFQNLIDNAVKYGDDANVTIATEIDRVCVTVVDTGPGIPEDKLEAVFEPFYRLEHSRSRDTGGTGLGLAVARDIARLHGGELVLCNRQPRGLTAEVFLPR
jgi:signal transduction histidine kinase